MALGCLASWTTACRQPCVLVQFAVFDIHVTLCMYLLLRHGWGGVGVGLGWGGAITFMLSYVAPVLKRSCDAVYVLAATPCIFEQGCQSHGPTVDVASKCFALLSQRDDDTPCATLEKTARMKGFLQKKEIVYAVRKQ